MEKLSASSDPSPHRRSSRANPRKAVLAAGLSLLFPALAAQAGGTITFGEDKSVSIGLGMRSSFTHDKVDGAGSDTSSTDFNLESVRLYTSASLNKYIKGTFNTERKEDSSGADKVTVIDAYGQFEFMPEFNIWFGRMLPPTDRANLDGPYYLFAWDYPGVVSNYYSLNTGRDNGVLAWGKVLDNKIVYSVGAFEGRRSKTGGTALASNNNHLMYAGRVAFNFLDPEPAPAYYTGSSYYGAADIFTVALVGMYQANAVGAVGGAKDDYFVYSSDVLFEKKLGDAGVATLEGAYYKYDYNKDAFAADPGDKGNGISAPGNAYLIGAAYLIPTQVGWGKFQPYARYQKLNADADNADKKKWDIGLNYIIDGPNAKISVAYSKEDDDSASGTVTDKKFLVGVQLQF